MSRHMLHRALIICALSACLPVKAQDGVFDPSFNSMDGGMGRFDGLRWTEQQSAFPGEGVRALTAQPDGKLLVGGYFVGGAAGIEDPVLRPGVARLNTDGGQDGTFDAGSGFDGPVEVIVLQPDGKILVGGAFLTCQGQPRKGIARLHPDGALDGSFTIGSGTGGTVFEIAVQPDGRILLGGNFTTYDGLPANRIVRLLGDGSLDPSFNAGAGPNATVRAIAVQTDGRVLIGGDFTAVQASGRSHLARLLPDGLIDAAYNNGSLGVGPNDVVTDIIIGPGGTAFVGGLFSQFNGVLAAAPVKLLWTGAPDPVFNMGPSETPTSFYQGEVGLHYDASANVLTAWSSGDLRKANGTTGARLHGYNGGYDSWFYQLYCGSLFATSLAAVASDGSMYICLDGLYRLNGDLTLDGTFRAGLGLNRLPVNVQMTMDSVGRVVLAARDGAYWPLTSFNGTYHPNMLRLDPGGEIDPFFFRHGHSTGEFNGLEHFGGDTLLVSGSFSTICPGGGFGETLMLLKESTGTFYPVAGAGGSYGLIERQSDGRTVYAGFSGSAFVKRFMPDLTIDASYLTTLFGPGDLHCMAQAPDGRIYVGGDFTSANGSTRNRIVRIHANGGVDPAFDPLAGFDGPVRQLIVNPDGTLVCAGDFLSYQGMPTPRIAKLLPNADLDPAFDPGSGFATAPNAMVRYPDGRILIGGAIQSYDGQPVHGIVCINADGSMDDSFDQGSGFRINNSSGNSGMPGTGTVVDMEMQPNGQVVCLGEFHMYDGHGRNRVARIGSGTSVLVSARVLLEGAYDPDAYDGEGGMLPLIPRAQLPLSEPYRALGFVHVRGGSESTTAAVMQMQGAGAIIDWVLVELRDAQDPSQIVATRSGLLRADGWIADMDGSSPLRFFGTPMGQYFLAVRHRNHLGIMSEAPVFLGSQPIPIDFTGPNYGTYGTNAQKEVNGVRMLWAGDVNRDGTLKYVGENNDRDPILLSIGGNLPTSTITGYRSEDINLDGMVRYVGEVNDRDPILVNIGGTVPTNTRQAQLP